MIKRWSKHARQIGAFAFAALQVAGPARAAEAEAMARLSSPPLGLPSLALTAEQQPNAAMVSLGRKLFFDRRLSHNGTMSCGMCHVPEQGFTNNELMTPVGVAGRSGRRNAPTLLNVAYQKRLFHDGAETSLETQVISPLIAKNEMANPSMGFVIEKLRRLDDYRGLFEDAFGGSASVARLGAALATWQRTLLAANSPFDRWLYGGEKEALTNQQKLGFVLFTGRAGCAACHQIGQEDALLTDHEFHDTGLGYYKTVVAFELVKPVPVEIAPGVVIPVARDVVESVGERPEPDLGRYEVTLDLADMWKFKTPSLRNVAVTAPYMHDGSFGTLEDVVAFYRQGGFPHDRIDPLIQPLDIDDSEAAALVAFLESLTADNLDALIADARSVAVGN